MLPQRFLFRGLSSRNRRRSRTPLRRNPPRRLRTLRPEIRKKRRDARRQRANKQSARLPNSRCRPERRPWKRAENRPSTRPGTLRVRPPGIRRGCHPEIRPARRLKGCLKRRPKVHPMDRPKSGPRGCRTPGIPDRRNRKFRRRSKPLRGWSIRFWSCNASTATITVCWKPSPGGVCGG